MHQSGHSRAHSMQAVQFSSWRAMAPRDRGAGCSLTFGYGTVTGPPPRLAGLSVWTISPKVTPRPLIRPLNGASGTGALLHRAHGAHHRTTTSTAVTVIHTSERGIRYFQASFCSWSSRKRGYVNRTQKMTKPTSMILASRTIGPRTYQMPLSMGMPSGRDH